MTAEYAPPAPKRRRLPIAIGIAAAVALLIAAGVTVYLLVAGRGFTVTGGLELTDRPTANTECQRGVGGYDDIHNGAQVVITDAAGETIAVGHLTGATRTSATRCSYTFEITGVPDGHDFYGVEVSHRGRLQFSRDDLNDGVTLTLGT